MAPDLPPNPLDLSGAWTALADPDRVGERDAWFSANRPGDDILLPGSAQTQGIGEAPTIDTPWVGAVTDHPFFSDERYARYRTPDDFRVPFWLQPERVYVGWIWYLRRIEIGPEHADTPLDLALERVHWESTVWIDGERIGSDRSLSAPHRFRVPALAAGEHTIAIRVDNSMIVDVGTNAHSVSDHTQGGWNGILGEMTLTPVSLLRLGPLELHPDIDARSVRVRATITADSLAGGRGTLALAARPLGDAPAPDPIEVPVVVEAERFTRGRETTSARVEATLPLGESARLWDEFDPFLYELTARLRPEGGTVPASVRSAEFGLRRVEAVGTQIAVNGRAVFLRGALECCVFPDTGYPPVDVEAWERIFRTCRDFGLNHLRFHSWCPPEAAFRAADRCGIYLQVEAPIWANQGAAIGEGGDVDGFLYAETERILVEYGSHPSFLLMAHGNEPREGPDVPFLERWVSFARHRDPRRLYTTAGGWPRLAVSDFDCIPDPRIQAWGEGMGSRINARPPETVTDYAAFVDGAERPIVTHESGQWCAYPNLREIDKYTGLMRAKNYEIARDFLDDAGMLAQADDMLHASGRLQVMAYKEEVESLLRTSGFGGVQLLGLSDFPGQGTAPVGVLDAFWEEKGYVTAAEFSRFFGPTVPLALLERRTWAASDDLVADVKVAHFGPRDLAGAISWRLVDEAGRELGSGMLEPGTIERGNARVYGSIRVSLAGVRVATRARLVIAVEAPGVVAENDWEIWVYPAVSPEGNGTLVTRSADEALAALAEGRRVLLVPRADDLRSPVVFGFSPVFWNTSWTSGQPPHTLGILCDPAHPAFARFPTDPHTNWQWWELLHDATALHLAGPAVDMRPVVQAIDSWFDARRLGLVVEARVGEGRLMVCTPDVVTDLDERLVARQLRASLEGYLASDAFDPETSLAPEEVRALLAGRLEG
ncbi:glycoside hydrolase [Microbacterium excoecariae]|uniref:glycoside hydrolase n=1 Tax=Microbacterium excoecariae TaxID=2715210 RepID=UPI001408596E|nr:glycoside hydrolase [Microbacterium excoecariae]NHI16552.1 glycoside hydrolase [Microbacterium excoecariae]